MRLFKVKYLEITNVCSDFLEMAKHLATTIIDERDFDLVDKTILPVIETECHGRSVEGNRGHAGKRYKYEAFNIRLKVCSDDHGLFNGDDECAAKGYGGREVLGSLEYMKQHQPGKCYHNARLDLDNTPAVYTHGWPNVTLSPCLVVFGVHENGRFKYPFDVRSGLPWLSGSGSC